LDNGQYYLIKGMRWAARAIALGAAAFLLTMLIGTAIAEALNEALEPITTAGILLGILGAIALAGCILSWWRERLAGILLILASAGLGIHIGIYAGRNHILAWVMMGFPYFLAGALLLISQWLSQKELQE